MCVFSFSTRLGIMPVCILALALVSFLVVGGTSNLNIHLKLSPEAEAAAISVNTMLTQACKGNDVDLTDTEQPHITMYLTSFDFPDSVVWKLSNLTAAGPPSPLLPDNGCAPIKLQSVVVSGCYAMWQVQPNACLQHISDAVVNATFSYATPNQTIPDWVKQLPEPLRSEKEEMVRRSPSKSACRRVDFHLASLNMKKYEIQTGDDLHFPKNYVGDSISVYANERKC